MSPAWQFLNHMACGSHHQMMHEDRATGIRRETNPRSVYYYHPSDPACWPMFEEALARARYLGLVEFAPPAPGLDTEAAP